MWLELSVTADLAAVEAVSALFHQYGEGGVAIDQPFFSDPDGENYGIDSSRPAVVKTYLPLTDEGHERRRRVLEGLWHLSAFNLAPIGELRTREVQEEDWAHAWKEFYHPLRIGRLLIKPSWREAPLQDGDLVVELDPGMAFGTGLHQTTRMSLALLERVIQPGWTVIDQGTGSGILAVAAARLGAGRVLARDIAEVAVEAAIHTARRNGVEAVVQVERVPAHAADIDQVVLTPGQAGADLILANIVASVLVRLAAAFARAARPDGLLIGSGIIKERAAEVCLALEEVGFQILERLDEDEWVTLLVRLAGNHAIASL
jgi:ribosomal protein L11 methyltransferase